MSMFLTSDTDHDNCFERTELDHVFVVYDTDGECKLITCFFVFDSDGECKPIPCFLFQF